MNYYKIFLGTTFLTLGSLTSAVYAEAISMPNTFEENTPALASEVNSNFDTLAQESNAQDQRITTLESNQATVSTQVVTQTGTLNGYNPSTASVQCPIGTTVIGGGARSEGDFYGRCFAMQTSYPLVESNSWVTSLRRNDFGEGGSHCPNTNWSYEAYAVCLKLGD